jgi:hypothetical protein
MNTNNVWLQRAEQKNKKIDLSQMLDDYDLEIDFKLTRDNAQDDYGCQGSPQEEYTELYDEVFNNYKADSIHYAPADREDLCGHGVGYAESSTVSSSSAGCVSIVSGFGSGSMSSNSYFVSPNGC